MAKRSKKTDELSPTQLIALMDQEMGARPAGIGQMEISKPTKSGFSEFQRGALWALKLFQDQMDARQDTLRKISFDESRLTVDESGMLGSLRNVYGGYQDQVRG